MNTPQQIRRRDILEKCIGRGLLLGALPMSHSKLFSLWSQTEQQTLKPTPTEVLGPFYMKGAPDEPRMHKPGDPGFPLRVVGIVRNTRGEKIPGAEVDLWHADHVGRYDTKGYKYRSKLRIDEKSEYTVDTILPGHYVDRPAQHIHYMVAAPGHKTLITQAYFATDPFFEGDPDKNFSKRGMAQSREMVRPVKLFELGNPHAEITFDIILEKA